MLLNELNYYHSGGGAGVTMPAPVPPNAPGEVGPEGCETICPAVPPLKVILAPFIVPEPFVTVAPQIFVLVFQLFAGIVKFALSAVTFVPDCWVSVTGLSTKALASG
jgi:hypothetical protein